MDISRSDVASLGIKIPEKLLSGKGLVSYGVKLSFMFEKAFILADLAP